MTKLNRSFLTFIILTFSFTTYAAGRTLLSDSKVITAQINQKTLRCSRIGYGGSELKINLKGLDGWTLLDHSNSRFGEFNGEPCMTAGSCRELQNSDSGFDLDEILKTHSGLEKIIVNRVITESKTLVRDSDNNLVCQRTLTETLNTKLANITFHHQRSISETFDERACQK